MIIAIDFDGTICVDRYPGIGAQMPYAKEVINSLRTHGHYVIIWTCRTGNVLLEAINWLLKEGITFDRINAESPDNLEKYGDEGKKIFAHCYIDDRNFGGFPGWKAVEAELINKKNS